MKQYFLKSLLAVAIIGVSGLTASAAFSEFHRDQSNPLGRMRKIASPNRWSGTKNFRGMQRVSPQHTTPESDDFQYLLGPDGTEWFATCDYDVETIELEGGVATENRLKGYTYTIYDNNFKEIGTIHDIIDFKEGETRCAQVMLDITVSKKFFNYNDKYEVMVALCMNAENHTMNYRTKVYSVGGDKSDGLDVPVMEINGFPVDAVNTANQPWDENFYITFNQEINPDPNGEYEEYIDFLAAYKNHLTTYSKANISGEISVLMEREIPMLNLPGDQMNCPVMLSKNVDGRLTLVYQQYEKSFFVDPSGMGQDDSATPDNNLVIDVYQLNDVWPRTMELKSTTKIATTPSSSESTLYTFYGVGNLRYEEDINFSDYTSDGSPCFVVSVSEYVTYDDDNYNSSYYVYDVDGNRIKTLAENTYSFVLMSDIYGQEPQAMFIHAGDSYKFEFVDLYSGTSVATIDQIYKGIYPLSTSIDRVPTKEEYAYASATTAGVVADEESGTISAPVCWFDKNGEFIRIDQVPAGKGVELVEFNILSDALSPYVYNTDSKIEYMMLVKRRIENSENLREEFLIATVDDGAIYTFLPSEEKGALGSVYLIPGNNPQLIIVYNNDNKYLSESYTLPFTKFAGGTGTAADPYLIATAGDFKQIKSAPGTHYLLTDDIDCTGVSLSGMDDFSGSIDGAGHTISNVVLSGTGNVSLFGNCTEASFKNINFYDCRIDLTGSGETSLIASTARNSTFEDIHIRRLSVRGDKFDNLFAPIACNVWTKSRITSCEVNDADIKLPQSSGVGGIACDLRTGATIKSCFFSGKILAGTTLGGIASSTTTGDETITACHVDADLKAQNTIGGVIGYLKRSLVTQCYVEGTIEATEANKWTKAYAVGGIAGDLEGDWEAEEDVPVTGNLIGISSITIPETPLEEDYPHQLATVHRVVGRTSYNAQIEEAEYTDQGSSEILYEKGVSNNLVHSDLAVIDNDFAENTIEGVSIEKSEVTADLLQTQLGFAYGTDASAPWNIQSLHEYDPSLFYETMIIIPYANIEVEEGKTFNVDLAILSRDQLSEDELLSNFICEYDPTLMEMTGNYSYDGKTITIEFTTLKEGSSKLSISIMGSKAECNVVVVKNSSDPGAVDGITDASYLIFADGILTADGCSIDIYDMNGRILLTGTDSIAVGDLDHGLYVAVAKRSDGKTSSLKFIK